MSNFRAKRYLKIVLNAVLASIALAMLSVPLFLASERSAVGSDFLSFYVGGKIVSEGRGRLLYDIVTQKAVQDSVTNLSSEPLLPFRNPPFVGLFFSLFSQFPFVFSYKLFAILNTVTLFFTVLLAIRLWKNHSRSVLFWTLPFLFLTNIFAVVNGQLTIFLGLVLFGGYALLKKEKPFWTGILFGLLWIKPQVLIFLPFLLPIIRERWSFLKGFLLNSLILFFVSLATSGVNVVYSYPSFLSLTENPIYGSRSWEMISVQSLVSLFSTQGQIIGILLTVTLFLFILGTLYKKRDIFSFETVYATALIFMVPVTYHVLPHDYALLVPAFYLILVEFERTKDQRFLLSLVLLFGASLLAVFGTPVLSFILTISSGALLLFGSKKGIQVTKVSQ